VLMFQATEGKTPDWPGPVTWRCHVDGVDAYRIACTHNGITAAASLAEIGIVLAEHTDLRSAS
jgi:enterobactin synthetase component F